MDIPVTPPLIKWLGTKKLLNPSPADNMPKTTSMKFTIPLLACMPKYTAIFYSETRRRLLQLKQNHRPLVVYLYPQGNKSTIMKIITLHTRIDPAELREHIRQHLNPLFKEARTIEINFVVSGSGNIIEIT
jgi:hypothetical protein